MSAREDVERYIEDKAFAERVRDTGEQYHYFSEDFKDGVERAARIAVEMMQTYFAEERRLEEQQAREQREGDPLDNEPIPPRDPPRRSRREPGGLTMSRSFTMVQFRADGESVTHVLINVEYIESVTSNSEGVCITTVSGEQHWVAEHLADVLRTIEQAVEAS